ncbi:MAG TPA: CHAT domain-containing protein, partial [Candidatus Eisenbacteria bacterium]|nr:CHAT domain-containing protein [Candidatus Eisenbacteria bacterium]
RQPRWRRRAATQDGAAARRRIGTLRAELEACYARLWRSGAEASGVRRGATLAVERRALALEGKLRRLAAATAVPERAFEPERSGRGVEVIYFSAAGRLGALCRSGGRLTVQRDLAPVDDVERRVRLLHYHMEVRGTRLAELDRHRETMRGRMREHLQALADRLLQPVLPATWEGPVRITPWGPLHRVPFHALPWRGAPLVEHAEVVLEPGRGGAPLGPGRHGALVVAHAAWETDAIEDEARSVAARLEAGGVEVERAVGAEATRARLGSRAADAALVHLAGHAVYRAEHPEFSALKLADGWISARDLAALPLAGACVVLSACESGPRGVVAGDEMLGLARGLRRAGASAVVASLWRVDDRATRAFMDELYRSWAAGGRLGAALCDVQRRAAAHGADVYLWAPFCLMGEPDVGWPNTLQTAPGRRYA